MEKKIVDLGNKYIHAKEIYEIKDKPAWAIVNTKSGGEIACVAYYPAWRRHVMFTDAPAIFDVGCLESVIKFINGIVHTLPNLEKELKSE